MLEQQVLKNIFLVFYGGVAALNLAASLYLFFRRSNALAPDITSAAHLRRWTAAFFAASALSHLWSLPVFLLPSRDDAMLSYLVAAMLDCMTVAPLAIVILFAMFQDRSRPLWPAAVMVVPAVVVLALCVVGRSDALLPMLYAYVAKF